MKSFFALVLLLLPAVAAYGSSAPEQESCAQTLSFADLPQPQFAIPDVYPWGYLSADGEIAGLLPGLLNHLREKTGLTYKSVLMPYSRIVHSLQNGSIDSAVLMDDQSYHNVDAVAKLVNLEILIVTRADAPPVTSLDDLAGKRVGFLRGWESAFTFYREHNIEGVEVNTTNQGLALMIRDRLDAMTGSPFSVPLAIQSMGLDPARFRASFRRGIGSMSLYLSRTSQQEQNLQALREAMDCIHLDSYAEEYFRAQEMDSLTSNDAGPAKTPLPPADSQWHRAVQ
ncbi:substrate-binding periplasmic protein [Halioxenophilus sp. WMMB6]|uniref:substrate-binding periplasmic protein n=1 Tax=Halioxenophilus sp. WMMB6 TaxID=3073815 RepID=UPI00295E2E9A|nr:transporter substrate-binding domain-containing protein [Halioxenophilus sp. WMMB6]